MGGTLDANRLKVRISEHVFYLKPPSSRPVWDSTWVLSDRLIGVSDGPSIICPTGCYVGWVWVTVRALDSSPGPLSEIEHLGWEEGDEVSIPITSRMDMQSPTVSARHRAVYVPTNPGIHRVRVTARGRWTDYGGIADGDPHEEFEVTIWPTGSSAPPERRVVHGPPWA